MHRAALLFLCSILMANAQTGGDNFDDLVRRAQAAIDSNPADAAQLYRQALVIKPDWAEGWFYLGGAFQQLDRNPEAADALRHALKLAPERGVTWALLGLTEAELDDTDQALADIQKGEGLGLGTNHIFESVVRAKAAQLFIINSNFDEALSQLYPLAKRTDISPDVPETMGLCALGLPVKLARLTPQQHALVAAAGKAAWLSASQHPTEAVTAYQQLLQEYPTEPGVHYAKGLYLMETDLTGALAEFQNELRNNPTHWPSLIVIASIKLKQGDTEEAIQGLQRAIQLVPVSLRWLCHAELGRAALAEDKPDVAIQELVPAVQQRPGVAQVHFLLSQAYRRAGKHQEEQKEIIVFQRLKTQEDPLGVVGMRPFSLTGK